MKKALLIMAALVLFTGFAFADISAGMWGRTIFSLAAASDPGTGTMSPITQGWGPSWSGDYHGPRENMGWSFSTDKLGFNYTAYIDGKSINLANLYGTLKVMPDMATVMIGKFSGDGFDNFRKTSPHPLNDKNNGNVGRMDGWGIIADVAPKGTGFEAAVMWSTGDPWVKNPDTVAAAPGDVTPGTIDSNSFNLQGTMLNTDIALSYTVPSMVKITAGSTVDGDLYPKQTIRNIFGRVEVLMVPNLTAWADVKYTGLESLPTGGNINALLAAGYNMDALGLVLAAQMGMGLPKTGTGTTTYDVFPEVFYTVGPVTVGLYAGISGSTLAAPVPGMKIEIQPYVKINDFNCRIAFDYIMNGDMIDATKDFSWEIPVVIDFGF